MGYTDTYMNGYRLNDKDVDAMVRWLQTHHPENANKEYASAFLVAMKLSYRQVGWDDPDKLENFYSDYDKKYQIRMAKRLTSEPPGQ
jgi:hypothetical protein